MLEDNKHEWVQHMFLDGVPDRITLLCCPEDVIKCRDCKQFPGRLCDRCRIPLCHHCAATVIRGNPKDSPMVLCNDNFWGYTSEIIFKYQVRWLEAAIVSPVWTTMVVCYVEGDGGHLINEELQQQQFRTRVRGTAHSVHMPWEDILAELRENCMDQDILGVLPRRPECLKYILRVNLRVGTYDMRRVLRQMSVRPFVLLQLLYYLIDQGHEAFQGKRSAREMKEAMRQVVESEYAVSEDEKRKPEHLQEWHLPEDFVSCSSRETQCFREKQATPDRGAVDIESCINNSRPSSLVLEASVKTAADLTALQATAVSRSAGIAKGVLNVQTGHKWLNQWHGKYFSQILPFV